ncbi:Ig-like domain-containing protein [Mycolicibacterium sphagni]|uniref:Uncharacterized protein n=1 Tax=Mycolicibacterium sphagni TaxID=1786 RepID=A0A255DAV4_9MYCO|nr:Ig-like domain-containing protein [Mycolicibacterium sphagni]MCV7177943.1 hypothetical protein [Mycolicibacterium sphagni]OYN76394.1 hypothetical protein CG716_22565 [Mycolicibacterium sphagni]
MSLATAPTATAIRSTSAPNSQQGALAAVVASLVLTGPKAAATTDPGTAQYREAVTSAGQKLASALGTAGEIIHAYDEYVPEDVQNVVGGWANGIGTGLNEIRAGITNANVLKVWDGAGTLASDSFKAVGALGSVFSLAAVPGEIDELKTETTELGQFQDELEIAGGLAPAVWGYSGAKAMYDLADYDTSQLVKVGYLSPGVATFIDDAYGTVGGLAGWSFGAAVSTNLFFINVGSHIGDALVTGVAHLVDPGSFGLAPDTPGVGIPDANGVVTGYVVFSEPTKDLFFVVSDAPTQGTATVNDAGVFTYTPTPAAQQAAEVEGEDGTDTFTVTATNLKTGETADETVDVPVDPGTPRAGTPAVGTPDPTTGAVTGTAVFTDPSGGQLTYSVTTNPTQGSITQFDTATGAFTYTPPAGTAGTPVPGTPTVGIADPVTGVVTGTAVFTTNAAQTTTDTFTVTADNNVHQAGEVVTVPVAPNATGALTYSLTTAPTQGTVTVDSTTGAFTYTPNEAARVTAVTTPTTDTFTVTADSGLNSGTETITVPVSPDPIIGNWNVTYGSPGTVTMTLAGGSYTETVLAAGSVIGGSCVVPVGTNVATFTQTGPGTYGGQHSLFDTSTCALASQTSLTLSLSSDAQTLTGNIGNTWTVTFTKIPSSAAARTGSSAAAARV